MTQDKEEENLKKIELSIIFQQRFKAKSLLSSSNILKDRNQSEVDVAKFWICSKYRMHENSLIAKTAKKKCKLMRGIFVFP